MLRSPSRMARKLLELCDLLDLVEGVDVDVADQGHLDGIGDKRLSHS